MDGPMPLGMAHTTQMEMLAAVETHRQRLAETGSSDASSSIVRDSTLASRCGRALNSTCRNGRHRIGTVESESIKLGLTVGFYWPPFACPEPSSVSS
jgi:hypothetical protein